jgi:hypothetical protein
MLESDILRPWTSVHGGAVTDREPSRAAFGTADPTRMEQFHW